MTPGVWEAIDLSRLEVLQDTIYWKATVGSSRIPVRKAGVVHAVLFDWDIWADSTRSDILSTAPGMRNHAGDVAWGWLLQLQEEADERWNFGARPKQMKVAEGEMLDVFVEFIARGISIHARSR